MLWTLDFSTQQIEILPYESLGPIGDYSAKLAAARAYLGSKWVLATPINCKRQKQTQLRKVK